MTVFNRGYHYIPLKITLNYLFYLESTLKSDKLDYFSFLNRIFKKDKNQKEKFL